MACLQVKLCVAISEHFKNAIVFKVALQMSSFTLFTLLYFKDDGLLSHHVDSRRLRTSLREDVNANVFVTVVDHRCLEYNKTRYSTPCRHS